VKIAPVPAQILPRSNAAPGLLAHLITAKYVDSLPLHRQERIFARHGVALPRATQAAWIIGVAQQLQPLINLMDERVRACGYIRIDETPMQVLKGEKPAGSEHWMWVRVAGPPGQRLILFDYDASRGSQVAERLLEGASGYVQSDGYAVYDGVAAKLNLMHAGCMAQYPESGFIRSINMIRLQSSHIVHGIGGINRKAHDGYKDDRNASRSGFGFQGVTRAGVSPARRQNISSASRFICRLVVM
jgi:hypothetical protein